MASGSWADRVHARGPIPWGQVLRILSDTASALEYAETRHLVHRDIKPANLMVTETGATKLADLGLVLSVAPGSSDDHGPLVGTPLPRPGTRARRGVCCPVRPLRAPGPAPTNC
ncbi:MAG: protein kinase [Planctomycetota bacterium]